MRTEEGKSSSASRLSLSLFVRAPPRAISLLYARGNGERVGFFLVASNRNEKHLKTLNKQISFSPPFRKKRVKERKTTSATSEKQTRKTRAKYIKRERERERERRLDNDDDIDDDDDVKDERAG